MLDQDTTQKPMRCDRCQFWKAPKADEWEPVRAKMGDCDRTPHIEDMSKWDDDYEKRAILEEYADRTAAAGDASGYSAYLVTTADHFCAMFKEATTC